MLRKVPLPIDPIICGQYIEIAIPVKNAIEPVIDALDGHRGALLASSYEYPGRYTRWDMGFVDPPLVLVCVAHTSQSYQALQTHGRFAINILHLDHEQIARRFASSTGGADKFEGTGYRAGVMGLPILKDALAEIECTTIHAYPAGDHTIFVGQVEAADSRGDMGFEPLLYYRGKFHRLHPPEPR